MIHIRIDDGTDPHQRKFACGIGPELPPGDLYFWESERGALHRINCAGCGGPQLLGTPLSELSGRQPASKDFVRIASSWGFD